MPIDYSKWDHLVDSDDDIPTPPIVTNKKPVLLKIRSAYRQIDLDKVLFAGATSSLLEIPDVISAAITGIGFFVFLITLTRFCLLVSYTWSFSQDVYLVENTRPP